MAQIKQNHLPERDGDPSARIWLSNLVTHHIITFSAPLGALVVVQRQVGQTGREPDWLVHPSVSGERNQSPWKHTLNLLFVVVVAVAMRCICGRSLQATISRHLARVVKFAAAAVISGAPSAGKRRLFEMFAS